MLLTSLSNGEILQLNSISNEEISEEIYYEVISPETVGDASATGYFFAQVVNKALNVPVGLVMANKGGSRVESWLDR